MSQGDKSHKSKAGGAQGGAKPGGKSSESAEPSKAVDASRGAGHQRASDNAADTMFSGLADNKMFEQ